MTLQPPRTKVLSSCENKPKSCTDVPAGRARRRCYIRWSATTYAVRQSPKYGSVIDSLNCCVAGLWLVDNGKTRVLDRVRMNFGSRMGSLRVPVPGRKLSIVELGRAQVSEAGSAGSSSLSTTGCLGCLLVKSGLSKPLTPPHPPSGCFCPTPNTSVAAPASNIVGPALHQ